MLQLRGTLWQSKTLCALAALAATASFAQSSVTISGLIDTAYVDTNNKPGTDDTKGLAQNGTATTVLTIAGTEDLGGGLKANFQLQLSPDFINGAGVEGTSVSGTGTRSVGTGQQAFVGLSGGFGTVKLGRVNSASLEAWQAGSVFGTAIGSGYGSAGNIYTRYSATATATSESAPTRFNGAVRYESPVFSGFSASLMTVPKANPTSGETVNEIAAKYSNGPLNVVLASMEVKASGTAAAVGTTATSTSLPNTSFLTGGLTANAKNKLNTLAANYTMGAATLMGAYWTEKQGTTVDAKSYMLGAKYVMGATTLMASMGNNNDKTAANVDKKIYGLGADYALSKRTALYARYDVRDADSVSAADDKTKRTAIGVRHTF